MITPFLSLAAGAACLLFLSAQQQSKPIIVAADGSGDFKTVQEAVDAATGPVAIQIKPGVYKGRTEVGKDKRGITLRGMGAGPADVVLTNDWNASYVIPGGASTRPVGTSGSASTVVMGEDFRAENLTFENSAGETGQALALRISGDRAVIRNCRLLGWQDTLCADGGRQLFENCHIEGRVDFIFGRSIAVFDRCTILSKDNGKDSGYITAARTRPEDPFGYVFLDCELKGTDPTKPAWLGRPWQWDRGGNAAVAFIRCKMWPHLRPEGWNPWDLKDKKNEKPETVTRYREFGSTDLEGKPLDVSKRVGWSKQLTEEEAKGYTVQNVLKGADGWDPKR